MTEDFAIEIAIDIAIKIIDLTQNTFSENGEAYFGLKIGRVNTESIFEGYIGTFADFISEAFYLYQTPVSRMGGSILYHATNWAWLDRDISHFTQYVHGDNFLNVQVIQPYPIILKVNWEHANCDQNIT